MPLILNPERANEYGLVGIGGDLRADRLLQAYKSGIFPWYDEQSPICWWSPDPRAIFELDQFHAPRRLQRTMRTGRFRCTINQAFTEVMKGCAQRAEGTWIVPEMIDAYTRLHTLGWAHSVEAWRGEELAGGIYGVSIGGMFAGESMFTRIRDGSKVALTFLVEHLKRRGFELFDIQMLTEHTARLGAIEIRRGEYLKRLQRAVALPVTFID